MTFRTLIAVFLSLFLTGIPSLGQAKRTSKTRATNHAIREQNIRAELGFLASDAMQGRGSGTPFERIAAEYIASQFHQFGLEPAGDTDSTGRKGFVQHVSLSSARFTKASTLSVTVAFDVVASMPPGSSVEFGGPTQDTAKSSTWNAVGVLRGSDPKTAKKVIMLSAHLDHLGVSENTPAGGDAIFNGADDDASGCVAVLELARVLASGKRPKRTIYFICFGSEELGGYGAQYFVAHSPVPLSDIVADVTFEMLGRPDSKVPPNTLWLTGYERSTLGPALAKHGALLVADPHPEQQFFQRSDNYTLALRGVVAHTVSSFGLHADYHRPSDEISKIDFPFMTRSINSLLKPIRWLANSPFKPAWLPGQAPTRG
jgi:Zn-dependent M28 family amino/carboxypeptidase